MNIIIESDGRQIRERTKSQSAASDFKTQFDWKRRNLQVCDWINNPKRLRIWKETQTDSLFNMLWDHSILLLYIQALNCIWVVDFKKYWRLKL